MGILSREREVATRGDGWTLAARGAAGIVSPAGPRLLAKVLQGAGLDPGSRVVDLEAGFGAAARVALAAGPRSWTGVDSDPLAAEHLGRTLAGAGRSVACAPPDATGLDDDSASLVVVDGALSLRDDDRAQGILAEASRLLRPSGRLALIELSPGDEESELAALDDVGVHVRPVERLREMAEGAGLVVVGSLDGPLSTEPARDLARALGPRAAMKLARAATDEDVRRAATTVRQAFDAAAPHLRTAAVVAERPLIMGLRRPR